MRIALILAAFATLCGCCPKQYIAKVTRERDTITVVRVEREEVLRDTTIFVGVPVEIKSEQTLDTTSMLETSVAKSTASVSDGVLSHKLENKPTALPATAQIKDTRVVADTVTIIKQLDAETIIQEVNRLYWWQKTLMYFGILAAIILIIKIALKL